MSSKINTVNQELADLFSEESTTSTLSTERTSDVAFSCLFFSDVRKGISNKQKYNFAREMVEFADQTGFESVSFPERHFYEFGSIYANPAIAAAYFAPITKQVRFLAGAVTSTLHHPAEIVENWAMVDILSDGRVDLGFGSGWHKGDFILSPDTYENRTALRDERVPIIRRLWRGECIEFPGPGGEMIPTMVYPRPIQKEINVWYATFSEHGFEHAGRHGYNIFTMLYTIELDALEEKIQIYRKAREDAGLDPEAGTVTLLMHSFVHPDKDWVHHVVEAPFKEYIRSSIIPQMMAVGNNFNDAEIDKIIDYSYARYFNTSGIFGPIEDCKKQIDKVIRAGVNNIAFLQDFGVDYAAVIDSLEYMEQLVNLYENRSDSRPAHDEDKVRQLMEGESLSTSWNQQISQAVEAVKNGEWTQKQFASFLETVPDNAFTESKQQEVIALIERTKKGQGMSQAVEVEAEPNTVVHVASEEEAQPSIADSDYSPEKDLQDKLLASVKRVLKLSDSDLDWDKPLPEYGLDSIIAMQLATTLEKKIKVPIKPRWLIEYRTLRLFLDKLLQECEKQ